MKYSSLRKHKQHISNPFLEDGVLKIKTHKKSILAGKTNDVLVNTETSQVNGYTALMKWREVDEEQFVKLYSKNVALWLELSKPAQRVFGYLLGNLVKNNDMVFLNPNIIAEAVGYKSDNIVFAGLAELVDRKVIARTKHSNLYFLNPHFIFNGDRVVFAEMLIRKKKGKKDPAQLPIFAGKEEKEPS